MTTTTTPRSLNSLQYQENVIKVIGTYSAALEAAAKFFGTEENLSLNQLFTENEKQVWEAYTDSGSIDYLYIILSHE